MICISLSRDLNSQRFCPPFVRVDHTGMWLPQTSLGMVSQTGLPQDKLRRLTHRALNSAELWPQCSMDNNIQNASSLKAVTREIGCFEQQGKNDIDDDDDDDDDDYDDDDTIE